jgi:hypothetical protein
VNNLIYSNVENKSPCTQDCPNRTVTCKFDGSCDKYKKWNAIHTKQKEAEFKKNRTAHDLAYAYDARQKHRPSKNTTNALGIMR